MEKGFDINGIFPWSVLLFFPCSKRYKKVIPGLQDIFPLFCSWPFPGMQIFQSSPFHGSVNSIEANYYVREEIFLSDKKEDKNT